MSKSVNLGDTPAGSVSKNRAFVSGPLVTLADTNTAQTFTNKTLTSPTLTSPTITNAVSSVAVQTLAGVGANAATANAITVSSGGFVLATGGNNSVGVMLPVAAAGMCVTIKNDDAANGIMKVYPQTNSSINGTANSAFSMAANTMADFYAINATAWLTNKVPC